MAVILIEKDRRFEEEKKGFFEWVDEVRRRTKDIDPREVDAAVSEAVTAVKKSAK